MAPKESTGTDNTAFLLSCLVNVEKLPKWAEIAAMNGITGTTAVPAGASAQRKFKRLVDASGKFKLEGGKVVLGDPPPTAEDDDVDDAASADDTPATKPNKKRGRPLGSTKAAIKAKKAKVEKEETPEAGTSIADDEEKAE